MATKSNTANSALSGGSFVRADNSALPDSWNLVTPGTATEGCYFSGAHPAHGTQGIRFQTTTAVASAYTQWTTDGSVEQYTRFNYFHEPAGAAANIPNNVRIMQFGNTVGSCMDLELRTTNRIRLRDASTTQLYETAPLVVGQAYRIETYCKFQSGTGQAKIRIYSGYDSNTLFDSFDGSATSDFRGVPTYLRFGVITAATGVQLFMDDFQVRSDQFPGPVVSVPSATAVYKVDYFNKSQTLTTAASTTTGGTLSYVYSTLKTSVSGMTVTITGTGASRTLKASVPGVAVIRCVVTDSAGGSTTVDHVVEFLNRSWVRTSGGIFAPSAFSVPTITAPVPISFGTDTSGWHTVLEETFANGLANFNYIDNANQAPQGDNPDMRWRASQLSIGSVGGIRELQIATQRVGSVVNGGAVYYNKLAAAKRAVTTRVETVVAFDASPNVKGVGMLWPTIDNTWPANGELDMWEFGGGSRAGVGMNIHFGAQGSGGATQDQYHTPNNIDFAQYHNVAWEWGTVAGQEYNALEVDGIIYCDSRGPNGIGKTYWQRGTIPTPIPNNRCTPMYPIFQSNLAPTVTTANVPTTPCIMHIRGFRIMEKV